MLIKLKILRISSGTLKHSQKCFQKLQKSAEIRPPPVVSQPLIASPKGSAVIFTETLAHGANTWQNNEPRYGLFYKYNDRAAIYHCQEIRRPSDRAFSFMNADQKSYFNNAWQAFGPLENPRNEKPEFGRN